MCHFFSQAGATLATLAVDHCAKQLHAPPLAGVLGACPHPAHRWCGGPSGPVVGGTAACERGGHRR